MNEQKPTDGGAFIIVYRAVDGLRAETIESGDRRELEDRMTQLAILMPDREILACVPIFSYRNNPIKVPVRQ